jgi:hypothetical protein
VRTSSLLHAALVAGIVGGPACAAAARDVVTEPPPRPDRVVLVTADEPEYALLAREAQSRTNPGAGSRLLVMKDFACVLDRGVLTETHQDPSGKTDVIQETGVVENAWVASDGRGALVATLRYRDRVRLAEGTAPLGDDDFVGTTTLTWVEPSFPGGRFEVALEPGRVVRDAVALPLGFGAAVSTQVYDAPVADFRLYDLDGRVTMRVPEEEAATANIVATATGGFVAADLALATQRGLPDRAVRVYDVVRGTWWNYTWSYGSPEEPVSWTLDDAGVLELRFPGALRRYDRGGHPVGASGSLRERGRGSRLFNRLRN